MLGFHKIEIQYPYKQWGVGKIVPPHFHMSAKSPGISGVAHILACLVYHT